jgi:hypothetical protein
VSAAGSQLTGIAVGTALEEVEGDAARSLGLDVFSVTPGNVSFAGGAVSNVLFDSQLELGKYISPTTFATVLAPPGLRNCFGGSSETRPCVTPGVTLTHRTNKGYRFEASYTPQYLLDPPTLGGQTAEPGKKFGAFIIREWRF